MLQTITSLLIILVGLGLDQSYLREYHQSVNRRALFVLVSLPGLFLVSLGFVGILMVEPNLLSSVIFGEEDVRLSYAVIVVVISAYSSRYLSLILRMEERGLAFSMSQLLPKIIFLSGLVLIYLSGNQSTFLWLLIVHLFSILATTFVFAWNTRHVWIGFNYQQHIAAHKLGDLIVFGAPLMFAGLAFWGVEAIDKVMLRYLGSFADLGIYSIAIGIASVAGTLSIIFTTIWVPIAYRWSNESDCAVRIEAVAQKLVAVGSILISLAGACAWMLGFLLPIEYASVQYLVCLCMVPPVLYAIAEVTGSGLGINRKSTPIILITLVAASLNIAGNWLLIPLFGAGGAAISTAITYFIFFILRSEAAMRYWHPMRRKLIYGPISLVTLITILLSLIGPYFPKITTSIWLGLAMYLLVSNKILVLELIGLMRKSKDSVVAAETMLEEKIKSNKPGFKL